MCYDSAGPSTRTTASGRGLARDSAPRAPVGLHELQDEGWRTTRMTTPHPMPAWHQPVMAAEVLELLNPRPGAVLVDGTAGSGGHSLTMIPRVLPDGRLIAIDRDRESLELARQRLTEFAPQVTFVHGNYRELPRILNELGIPRVDGVLLDLGMSSLQVDQPQRGFSFSKEGPLDMRMDREQRATAESLVNHLSAAELAMILETLGEERFARRIAHRIVQERREQPISTTTQLARVVAGAVPSGARHGRLHPATRTFQALRMSVNDELGAIQDGLGCLHQALKPSGRVAILTFHSLEDRLVKHAFAEGARNGLWKALTRKPLRPGEDEVQRNPRARSAKLRAVEKI